MSGPATLPVGAAAPKAAVAPVARDGGSSAMITARLERLPMTAFQRNIFLIIATAWFFDSIDLGSLTFVLGSIKKNFGLSTAQAGFLSSMSFVGMFFGAAISGVLADRFGRKAIFQVSMIFWGLGSAWCAYAPDAQGFGYARLLLGFGMGMEFPVALAMVSEFVPTTKRGLYLAVMEGFWPIGFIAAGCLSLVLIPPFGWRAVFVAQTLPAFFLFVIRRYVPESPRWLATRGRFREASQVMDSIEAKIVARLSGRPLPAPTPVSTSAGVTTRFSFVELWRDEYASRTVMIWTTWFFALLGFYGLTTWLGALMESAGYTVTKSVTYTILISLAGVPGFIASAFMVEWMGRRPTAVVMLLGSAIAAFCYGHAPSFAFLIAFGLVMQFFLFGMWSVLYAYTPELYPTRARATGVGCASAVGRLGSLLGPTAIGLILPTLGHGGVFALGAGCFATAAAVVGWLGVETRGRSLEEISS